MLKGNLTRLQLIPLMPLPPTVTPSPKVPKPRPEIGDMLKNPTSVMLLDRKHLKCWNSDFSHRFVNPYFYTKWQKSTLDSSPRRKPERRGYSCQFPKRRYCYPTQDQHPCLQR